MLRCGSTISSLTMKRNEGKNKKETSQGTFSTQTSASHNSPLRPAGKSGQPTPGQPKTQGPPQPKQPSEEEAMQKSGAASPSPTRTSQTPQSPNLTRPARPTPEKPEGKERGRRRGGKEEGRAKTATTPRGKYCLCSTK